MLHVEHYILLKLITNEKAPRGASFFYPIYIKFFVNQGIYRGDFLGLPPPLGYFLSVAFTFFITII